MICDFCSKDYAEEYSNGIKCWGCGKWTRYNVLLGRNKSKKPYEPDLFFTHLSDQDRQEIFRKWGVESTLLNKYGIHKAWDKYIPGRSWISLPILDDYGRETFLQLRAWEGDHKQRFFTCPIGEITPDDTTWKSWFTKIGKLNENSPAERGKILAVTEGIMDGIRVSEFLPTVALLGSTPDPNKIYSLQSWGADRYLIVLDGDAIDKAYELQKHLGVTISQVVLLPDSKDPADLTPKQLGDILRQWR